LTGVDYHFDVYKNHDEWLDEAHQNEVEVDVWTVDGEEDLTRFANDARIDLITTNKPVLLQKILSEKNQ
jgi:glycerophosphoryl diester phosphodiesterase